MATKEKSDLRIQIGKKLLDIRTSRNETIKSVAISLHIDKSVISKIEHGIYRSLTIDLLEEFAVYYGVPLEVIVSLKDMEHFK